MATQVDIDALPAETAEQERWLAENGTLEGIDSPDASFEARPSLGATLATATTQLAASAGILEDDADGHMEVNDETDPMAGAGTAEVGPEPALLTGIVRSAQGLKARDAVDGTCDPFVKVVLVEGSSEQSLLFRCKTEVFQTGTLRNTADPVWAARGATFTCAVPAPDLPQWARVEGEVAFQVFDHNRGQRAEFIGQATVPIASLVDSGRDGLSRAGEQRARTLTLQLVPRSGASMPEDSLGTLKVTLQLFLPAHSAPRQPAATFPATKTAPSPPALRRPAGGAMSQEAAARDARRQRWVDRTSSRAARGQARTGAGPPPRPSRTVRPRSAAAVRGSGAPAASASTAAAAAATARRVAGRAGSQARTAMRPASSGSRRPALASSAIVRAKEQARVATEVR